MKVEQQGLNPVTCLSQVKDPRLLAIKPRSYMADKVKDIKSRRRLEVTYMLTYR